MANIKDFIKKIGNETVSLEEQQKALAAVEQTIVEAKAKREESIGKNVDLVISALKNIESKLESKLDELNNTPAKQGIQGQQGPAGRDGRDGVDGYAGRDGKDGIDGKDGKDGEDGISVTDAQIDFDGSLLITLSDGREIDAGTVIPLDVAKQIHSVSTNGGGTSQPVLDAIAALQATIATYGTMATQNANAVAITGGSINGTTIGATTPNTGTFTTITGQTEVLKGTGQNLAIYSEQFQQAGTWLFVAASATADTTTAPNGTNTADSLIEDNTSNTHNTYQQISVVANTTYTWSVYVKAVTRTLAYLRLGGAINKNAFFNLSTVTVGTVDVGLTAAVTSVGSGWYRLSINYVPTAAGTINWAVGGATTDGVIAYAGTTSATSLYLWGAQLELASSVGSYIQTTTTAVYGTPSLSFSGVAGIGLESNGALYVSPAGTGAIQAQATTSTATGGNARGTNAVDWQTARSAASQVASGTYATLGGGIQNTVSGFGATVAGGGTNAASVTYGTVGGGNGNNAGSYAFMGGGQSNSGLGYYNFVGGGFTNSGTTSSAVTTQSGTMNGTTSVTLSGSNANIKVGQLITGTSIATYTYVAAISGTALTLSQNASGSSTSTLSFFTPHGVVVGGGNNQATGSYSFIGGGGDAGTAANRNVASGDWSTVGGGWKNTASGLFSTAAGGTNNTASGIGSFIGGGGTFGTITQLAGNTASGMSSFVGAGFDNTSTSNGSFVGAGKANRSNAIYSAVIAGSDGTARTIWGNHVIPSLNPLAGTGTSQSATLVLGKQTTDATATVLTVDGGAAGTVNQVIMPNNSAYYFKGTVVAGKTAAGDTKGWTIEGVIKRGANAASTAIVGTATVTSNYADAGASTWAITATADTTNGGLAITVTGQAATTIRWVAKVETTEMTY